MIYICITRQKHILHYSAFLYFRKDVVTPTFAFLLYFHFLPDRRQTTYSNFFSASMKNSWAHHSASVLQAACVLRSSTAFYSIHCGTSLFFFRFLIQNNTKNRQAWVFETVLIGKQAHMAKTFFVFMYPSLLLEVGRILLLPSSGRCDSDPFLILQTDRTFVAHATAARLHIHTLSTCSMQHFPFSPCFRLIDHSHASAPLALCPSLQHFPMFTTPLLITGTSVSVMM